MPTEKLKEVLTKHQVGLLVVVVEDFSLHKLPRLEVLKRKVDDGEIFNNVDVDFMIESIDGAMRTLSLIINNTELQEFYAYVASFYNELTRKALENEIKTNN